MIIISGLSGSGKSTAIRVLEDLGYFCIDNLPVVLLPQVLRLCRSSGEEIEQIALGIDVRERGFFPAYPEVFSELRAAGYDLRIFFLEASDAVLLRRFSETRRPHPLAPHASVLEGIGREREIMGDLRARADRVIDTSELTVHGLREQITALLSRPFEEMDRLAVTLSSFGYKYGLPADADMVVDVRFLPNPHFVAELRPRSGRDPEVAAYVLRSEEGQAFLAQLTGLLELALPLYRREGKRYFTCAIGCTGGRHRSVAVVEALARKLIDGGHRVSVRHRDIDR